MSNIINHSETFSKEVSEILESSIKPENFTVFELQNNESFHNIRVKFGHEDKDVLIQIF